MCTYIHTRFKAKICLVGLFLKYVLFNNNSTHLVSKYNNYSTIAISTKVYALCTKVTTALSALLSALLESAFQKLFPLLVSS